MVVSNLQVQVAIVVLVMPSQLESDHQNLNQVPLHSEYGIAAATVEEYKGIQGDPMNWSPADWEEKSTSMSVINQANFFSSRWHVAV